MTYLDTLNISLKTVSIENIMSLEDLHYYNLISSEAERLHTFQDIMKAIWNFIKLALAKLKELMGRIIIGWRHRATRLKKLVLETYRSESLIRNVVVHTDICYCGWLISKSNPKYPDLEQQLNQYSERLNSFRGKLYQELAKSDINVKGINWNDCVKSLTINGFWDNTVIAYGANHALKVDHQFLSPNELKFVSEEPKLEPVYQVPLMDRGACIKICDCVYRVQDNFDKFIDNTLRDLEKTSLTLTDRNISHAQANDIKIFISKIYPMYTKSMRDFTEGALDLVEAMCRIVEVLPTARPNTPYHIRYRYKDKAPKLLN